MNKSSSAALIGLVVLLGGLRESCRAQQPSKAREDVDYTRAWFQKYLRAMKEPSLRELAGKDRTATVYRFLWLPSFHDPISVRFVKSDRGVILHAVRLKLDDNYRPVRIVERKSIELKTVHWKRIANHLEKARFWDLPTEKRAPFGREILDGHILGVFARVVFRESSGGGLLLDAIDEDRPLDDLGQQRRSVQRSPTL
jgi:hypothetical protein